MKILFCNIAWMKHYRGITEDDEVLSDSKFVKENGYGAEETNFLPIHHQDDEWIEYNDDVTVDIPNGDICLGYVEPKSTKYGEKRNLHLERIEGCNACVNEMAVNDVLVIFCAPHPDKTRKIGSVIVGWYHHAVVCRQPFTYEADDGTSYWANIITNSDNAILLPADKREKWHVPRAKKDGFGFGQDNIWYADARRNPKSSDVTKIKVEAYLNDLIKRIRQYEKNINVKTEAAVIHCANCGNELPSDSNFCDKCGKPVKSNK